MIDLFERTRKGHRQSDGHCKCNRFKGNTGETSQRQGGVHTLLHMGFSEHTDTILN